MVQHLEVAGSCSAEQFVGWLKRLGWGEIRLRVTPLEGTAASVITPDAWLPIVVETGGSAPSVTGCAEHLDGLRRLMPGRALAWVFVGRDGSWAVGTSIGSRNRTKVHVGSFGQMRSWEQDLWRTFEEVREPTRAALRLHHHLERRELHHAFFRRSSSAVREVAQGWQASRELSESERHRLAVLFFARLVFVHVLQHRGWLRGDTRFVANQLLTPGRAQLYGRRLAPLFEALRTDPALRDHVWLEGARARARRDGVLDGVDTRRQRYPDVPWLHGGLFEPDPLEQERPDLELPDEVVRRVLLRVFERYRFVHSESPDEPAAIDPSMLGTLFERLMEPGERSRSGAFYTPPELVDVLVRRALEPVLEQHLGADLAARVAVTAELDRAQARRVVNTIEQLRVLDPACGSGAFLLGVLRYLAPRLHRARQTLEPGATLFDAVRSVATLCLYGVDVQPMATTIAALRLWLAMVSACGGRGDEGRVSGEAHPADRSGPVERGGPADRDSTHRPGSAAAHTPPGPLQPTPFDPRSRGAALDGAGRRALEVNLPALYHQLRTGDALASPFERATSERLLVPEAARRSLVLAADQLHASAGHDRPAALAALQAAEAEALRGVLELAAAQRRYALSELEHPPQLSLPDAAPARRARAHTELVATARAELEAVEGLLARARAAGWRLGFDMHLHWPDVFEDGGFDVVIGNPPWVRGADVDPELRRTLQRLRPEMNPTGRAFGVQPDLSVAFVARGLGWLRRGGALAFVVPGKLLRADYAARLRRRLVEHTRLLHVDELASRGENPFAAAVCPATLVAINEPPGRTQLTTLVLEHGEVTRVPQRALSVDGPGSAFAMVPGPHAHVAAQLADRHQRRLGEILTPRYGVKTGSNELFLNPDATIDGAATVPALRGSGVRPWRAACPDRLLFAHDRRTGAPLPEDALPPSVTEWARRNEAALRRRADCRDDHHPWQVYRTHEDVLGHRVAWRDIARRLEAVPLAPVTDGGPVALNTTYVIGVPDARTAGRLAAWLNSTHVRLAADLRAERVMNGFRRYRAAVLAQLPVPDDLLDPHARRWEAIDQAVSDWHSDGDIRRLELRLGQAVEALVGTWRPDITPPRRLSLPPDPFSAWEPDGSLT